MDLFCSNCGNRLREGTKFCNKCGNQVNTEQSNNNPFNNQFQNNINTGFTPYSNINQPLPTEQSPSAIADINSILIRAKFLVDAGDYSQANTFCDQALNINAETGNAYLIKLFIEYKVNSIEKLESLNKPFDSSINYQYFMRFGDDETKSRLSQVLLNFYNKPLTTKDLLFGNYYGKRNINRLSNEEFIIVYLFGLLKAFLLLILIIVFFICLNILRVSLSEVFILIILIAVISYCVSTRR